MARWSSAILAAFIGVIAAGCALPISGVARDAQGLIAVSRLPASFSRCESGKGRLQCRAVPFRSPGRLESGMSGLALVGSNLYYTSASYSAQHELRQVVENFTIDDTGRVMPGPCAPLLVPLFADDERRAQGLSALAYDPERKVLYLAKRSNKARLFAAQLDAKSCPTGNFIDLHPPQTLPDYAAIAYSPKRQTLYLLSARRPELIEWSLKRDASLRSFADWPKAQRQFSRLSAPFSLLLDDAHDTLSIVDRQGRVLLLAL